MSPYNSVETKKTGYLIFNSKKTAGNGQLINNKWTWSYPFEGKYNPSKRYLDEKDILNIDTNLATWWSGPPTSNEDLVENSFFDLIPSSWLTEDEPFSYAARKKKKEKVKTFLPLPAGKYDYSKFIGTGQNPGPCAGRNGLRASFDVPTDASYDNTGFSYVIPSDINLNQTINSTHTQICNQPVPQGANCAR